MVRLAARGTGDGCEEGAGHSRALVRSVLVGHGRAMAALVVWPLVGCRRCILALEDTARWGKDPTRTLGDALRVEQAG